MKRCSISASRTFNRSAVLQAERLYPSKLSLDDGDFILELLNEPPFKRSIGEKGVRTRDDAVNYIEYGPMNSYHE